MVHGGPWLFYRWTFEPLTQLLASRGYAVLKLNYRGSAGYGSRFREAAVGELAGRVQEDVEDAADWAEREGHGDGSRLALLGDSFGGFSVLTAMIRGRVRVRAGVVMNGVVDTEAMVDENTFSAEGRALWAKYLGTGDADEMRRILREVSPLRHAGRSAPRSSSSPETRTGWCRPAMRRRSPASSGGAARWPSFSPSPARDTRSRGPRTSSGRTARS